MFSESSSCVSEVGAASSLEVSPVIEASTEVSAFTRVMPSLKVKDEVTSFKTEDVKPTSILKRSPPKITSIDSSIKREKTEESKEDNFDLSSDSDVAFEEEESEEEDTDDEWDLKPDELPAPVYMIDYLGDAQL